MEEYGFKVYKNFKTSIKTVDIYAVLPTTMGDFGIVMECNNYDKKWEVGIDILKEMEKVSQNLNSSKIAIVTTSSFSNQAENYANKKNIKLINRNDLLVLARKLSNNENISEGPMIFDEENNDFIGEDFNEDYEYDESDINYISQNSNNDLNASGNGLYPNHNILEKHNDKPKNNITEFFSKKSSASKSLTYQKPYTNESPLFEKIKPFFSNTIFLIFLVVLISYLLSYILGVMANLSQGIVGLAEMITSLLLSYGLVFIFNREGISVLVKGTIVFFVSLIILIILIILI